MGKRASGTSDGAAAYNKRQKTYHDVPTGEQVHDSDQLRRLLAFDQNMRTAQHGLQSFKKLLDKANAKSTDADRQPGVAIIRGYLKSVQPRETGEDAVFLNDVMEMWSFASQVNDDGVMSSVAIVLSLLLQVISDNLDLVPYGLGICQTLLQERQLKSVSRNLSADKGKAFIICPTLRLLCEAVCLDGGAYAKRIFRARASTFASLGRNLQIVYLGDGPEDVRKASVRTNAVRFFLTCLKFLNSDGREELLAQKDLLSHVTFLMKNDPPALVMDIITSLKTNVLMDTKIARDRKFKSFNTRSLMRFLGLYAYSNTFASQDDVDQVIEKAHQFLVYLCTNSTAGVLYPSKGLYPKEADEESSVPRNASQAKADGNLWADKFRDGVPVYNFVLSEFASKLRPWSNLKHNELLIAIFQAAPELIADYFFNHRSFTFEPKLSMTWIGYAAFLFNTMTIPLPPAFGDTSLYANTPPPTSILLDNIIPLPINQKVLNRCFTSKSNLTSFFATRILVQALEKLTVALKMHEDGGRKQNQTWTDASRRLIDSFCQRIPDMKEVVRCYKSIPAENALHKTLASRLLRLYYEIVPRIALAANFDVSPFFVEVLGSIQQNQSDDPTTASFAIMELRSLVSIASYSPGMRWFAKTDSSNGGKGYSAFTSLLQILCDSDDTAPLAQLQSVLSDVAIENQVVAKKTRLVALLRALRCASSGSKAANIPWVYLDNCITRCAGSPIKYLEQMTTLPENAQFSLLNIVLQEQLSFALDGANKTKATEIGSFMSLYFNALNLAGESKSHLEECYSKITEQILATKASKMPSLGDKSEKKALQRINIEEPESSKVTETSAQPGVMVDEARLEEMLHQPFKLEDDNSALVKWSTKNVEDLVEDGLAAGLIKLLASPHINIRKEALTNILKMAAKIKESSYEEKMQVWLLLSELAESSRPLVDAGPVPSSFVSFATHALDVLRSPLHPLYAKVNAFLTRSPAWPAEKLPMAHDVLHGAPGEDDRYYTELAWLLAHLLDSLRTPSDLGVFHRKRWLEKVLALAANPYLRANLRARVLRIVYRATCIDGGSTTLVTRFGVMSWLDGRRAAADSPEDAAVYVALMRRVWETCDQARVTAWSKGGVQKLLETVLG
ncbi:ribosome biogenesis protein Urb1 [Cordyceps fumosorosea ARSEF 2679]|uniref:Ribosome biogenesis protein Urb1 n=1 Tax=Cordyceps fumosorosea (strain ARSEF 2679) TaxID=1081104 RepID=A0A162LDE3_CORFA|nr:ribosome biogenesis protein Urb1 [Cordyceps fumosorosea ARSEF 2679]OAA69024.1 ribosome biogenesis protein Urb1 [Cordyceps fumosorosea ARSEF 2679]